jgi:hypothetical protein
MDRWQGDLELRAAGLGLAHQKEGEMTNDSGGANDTDADPSAKTAATDFSNYGWMTRTFYVTARNLSVKRVWAIDDFDREKGPELRLLIQGRASVQHGDEQAPGRVSSPAYRVGRRISLMPPTGTPGLAPLLHSPCHDCPAPGTDGHLLMNHLNDLLPAAPPTSLLQNLSIVG